MNAPIRTAKLTDEEVLLLRARKARGERISVKEEADRFNCGLETIRKVLRGDTFRHLLKGASVLASRPSTGPSEDEVAASLNRFLTEVKSVEPLENPDADIHELLKGSISGGLQ
jgi:hypothetical protein